MNDESQRQHLGEYIKSQHNGNMIIDDYHGYDSIRNSHGTGFETFKQFEDNEEITENTIFIGSEVETGRENSFSRIMLNKMAECSKDFQCETD